jgi:hypothetical protein
MSSDVKPLRLLHPRGRTAANYRSIVARCTRKGFLRGDSVFEKWLPLVEALRTLLTSPDADPLRFSPAAAARSPPLQARCQDQGKPLPVSLVLVDRAENPLAPAAARRRVPPCSLKARTSASSRAANSAEFGPFARFARLGYRAFQRNQRIPMKANTKVYPRHARSESVS